MDTITIAEAITAEAFSHDGIDESNVISLIRKGQKNIMELASLRAWQLHELHPIDEVDDLIARVTNGGRIDIFA